MEVQQGCMVNVFMVGLCEMKACWDDGSVQLDLDETMDGSTVVVCKRCCAVS